MDRRGGAMPNPTKWRMWKDPLFHSFGRGSSKPAAAVELLPVDADLDPVRIDAVAHSIAACAVDDVHVDPRRLVDFARDTVDHPRRRLKNGLRVRLREGQIVLVDEQVPERLRPHRMVGRRSGWGQGRTGPRYCN